MRHVQQLLSCLYVGRAGKREEEFASAVAQRLEKFVVVCYSIPIPMWATLELIHRRRFYSSSDVWRCCVCTGKEHKLDASCLGCNFELKIYVAYVFVLGVPPDFAQVLERKK